jgi:hypothetical protein
MRDFISVEEVLIMVLRLNHLTCLVSGFFSTIPPTEFDKTNFYQEREVLITMRKSKSIKLKNFFSTRQMQEKKIKLFSSFLFRFNPYTEILNENLYSYMCV